MSWSKRKLGRAECKAASYRIISVEQRGQILQALDAGSYQVSLLNGPQVALAGACGLLTHASIYQGWCWIGIQCSLSA